jgi:osmotically-inducible protein OsmY
LKIIRAAHIVAGAVAIAISCHACAQASSAASASGTVASPATQSGKAADRALRKRVLTALARAKGLRATGITVRARNGAILLEGWVPEEEQVDLATRVARGVPGVASVENALTLSTF